EQRAVELHQIGVERQDHERQVGIDDAEIDREIGIEQREGADVEQPEEVVDDAVVLEQADPGVDTQQERTPERQDDQHQQHIAQAVRRAGEDIGHRVANEQRQHGRDRRDLQRAQIGVKVE